MRDPSMIRAYPALRLAALGVVFALTLSDSALSAAAGTPNVEAASQLQTGRHIVLVAGCNHCNTEGWQDSNGTVPEKSWLKGGHAPRNVPAPELRHFAKSMSAGAWVALFHGTYKIEPMPWFNFRSSSDVDLIALHTYIGSLQ
jgi:hypothetical protein